MPKEARVSADIWSPDSDFRGLRWSSQWLYQLLLSQPDIGWSGTIKYSPRRWASMAEDATPDQVIEAARRLQARNYVVVDEDHEELWVRAFVRRNQVVKNVKLYEGFNYSANAIMSATIRAGLVRELDRVQEELRDAVRWNRFLSALSGWVRQALLPDGPGQQGLPGVVAEVHTLRADVEAIPAESLAADLGLPGSPGGSPPGRPGGSPLNPILNPQSSIPPTSTASTSPPPPSAADGAAAGRLVKSAIELLAADEYQAEVTGGRAPARMPAAAIRKRAQDLTRLHWVELFELARTEPAGSARQLLQTWRRRQTESTKLEKARNLGERLGPTYADEAEFVEWLEREFGDDELGRRCRAIALEARSNVLQAVEA